MGKMTPLKALEQIGNQVSTDGILIKHSVEFEIIEKALAENNKTATATPNEDGSYRPQKPQWEVEFDKMVEQSDWRCLTLFAKAYAKHMHPHQTIIITPTGVELVEGQKCETFDLDKE